MQGKIFAESINLYQDEARILFDYYKKAAKKIVKEEMDLEKSLETAHSEITLAEKNKKKGVIITVVFGVMGLVGGILLFPFGFILALGCIKGVLDIHKANTAREENESKALGFKEAYDDIRRNYRVKKMGVVYVPVATTVPFERKNFMVDHTGQVGETEFKMSKVRKPAELLESLNSLENSIKEAPVVETASSPEEVDTSDYSTSIQHIKVYDYMGNIDRQVRNVRYLLHDSDSISLSLPAVLPGSETAAFIKEFAATDPGDKPIVPVFNTDGFKEKIDAFHSLHVMKKSFEQNANENQTAYFKKLIGRLAESVQILSKAKMNGANRIIDYAGGIFSTVLKASFNQYSPFLEAEEIERIRSASFDYQDSVDGYTPFSLKSSSRVKYDLFSTAWIAEDQSRTSMPFGMHQIQEEVLAPVIQNLMAENRIERLKIYNGIKDQKIDYLNQWHRDTEDFYGRNRAEAADLINKMRETYADYIRSLNTYKALQETQIAMNKTHSLDSAEVLQQNKDVEIIAGFELQAQQFNQKQEEFSEFMIRLKDNIDEKAAQFGYIPYYEATLRDKEYRDIAQSTDHLQELDLRRKKLIAISPYVAQHAKLPPPPQVEQQMYDDFAIDLLREAAGDMEPASLEGNQ
ncbi:MAG: hypothetical protein LBB48_05585 [Treponema sp.]|jgi:uncharacterized coiled-coil protein SlyX|nr:hypothetical protein [Treponema sp.]